MRTRRAQPARVCGNHFNRIDNMQTADVERITRTVSAWPGVKADRFRHNGTEFLLEWREIGHIHGLEHVDIPFPRSIRDELVASGRAEPHSVLARSGWVSIPLRSNLDVDHAIELLKLSYDLAVTN